MFGGCEAGRSDGLGADRRANAAMSLVFSSAENCAAYTRFGPVVALCLLPLSVKNLKVKFVAMEDTHKLLRGNELEGKC